MEGRERRAFRWPADWRRGPSKGLLALYYCILWPRRAWSPQSRIQFWPTSRGATNARPPAADDLNGDGTKGPGQLANATPRETILWPVGQIHAIPLEEAHARRVLCNPCGTRLQGLRGFPPPAPTPEPRPNHETQKRGRTSDNPSWTSD